MLDPDSDPLLSSFQTRHCSNGGEYKCNDMARSSPTFPIMWYPTLSWMKVSSPSVKVEFWVQTRVTAFSCPCPCPCSCSISPVPVSVLVPPPSPPPPPTFTGAYRFSLMLPWRTRIQHPLHGWSWMGDDLWGFQQSSNSVNVSWSVAMRFQVYFLRGWVWEWRDISLGFSWSLWNRDMTCSVLWSWVSASACVFACACATCAWIMVEGSKLMNSSRDILWLLVLLLDLLLFRCLLRFVNIDDVIQTGEDERFVRLSSLEWMELMGAIFGFNNADWDCRRRSVAGLWRLRMIQELFYLCSSIYNIVLEWINELMLGVNGTYRTKEAMLNSHSIARVMIFRVRSVECIFVLLSQVQCGINHQSQKSEGPSE